MNWVGGSRNRLVMKNDAKKQREFFEKRKMQQRLKKMGVASPQGISDSMDLMTLFIVNQIAAKKENKVAVLGSCLGGSKHKRNEPLVLPMSPCSPSQLTLVESEPQYSVQGINKRKNVTSQGFKCRQLSPVQESAFSDNSASDYLPRITDPLSPFSSTSSASSGQGMFPMQLNLQQRSQMQTQLPPHCSPPPRDISGLEHPKPFSQPRGLTNCVPWSCGSNPLINPLETPTAAQVLFGSPELDHTETRGHKRHEVTSSLSQPEDREHMLDFNLDQSETEQQFEEDVFRGFSTEECQRQASYFGRGKLKIHLKDDTPAKCLTLQTVPDPQCMGVEPYRCSDMNLSRQEHSNGSMNGCDCSPSFSCRESYVISDSNDENACCQTRLQDVSSYMDQACCADSLNPNLGFQGNPQQMHIQPRLLTPLLKPQTNFNDDQKVVENVTPPDRAIGSSSQQMRCHTAQVDSPQAVAQTQSSESCKCEKTSSETRDVETQTANIREAETCDASTQCSFVANSAAKAGGVNFRPPPVDVSVQRPATGRQADTTAEPNKHSLSPYKAEGGGKHMPGSKNKSRAGFVSGRSVVNKFTTNKSDGKVILQRPINPFLDALSMTDSRGGQGERGRQENGCLMKDLSSEAREEVASAARVSRHSEEAGTLEDIANILLLLKQRKTEG